MTNIIKKSNKSQLFASDITNVSYYPPCKIQYVIQRLMGFTDISTPNCIQSIEIQYIVVV